MEKQSVIVLIGPAGCGKTRLATMGSAAGLWQTVSSDAVREELYGDESVQKDHAKVFEIVHERVADILKKGGNVCVDATNLMPKHRKPFVDMARRFGAETCGVVYSGNLETCLARNASRERQVPPEVVERMFDTLHRPGYFPSLEEGFDILTTMETESEFLDEALGGFPSLRDFFRRFHGEQSKEGGTL